VSDDRSIQLDYEAPSVEDVELCAGTVEAASMVLASPPSD
jgi:hypothetical protein